MSEICGVKITPEDFGKRIAKAFLKNPTSNVFYWFQQAYDEFDGTDFDEVLYEWNEVARCLSIIAEGPSILDRKEGE